MENLNNLKMKQKQAVARQHKIASRLFEVRADNTMDAEDKANRLRILDGLIKEAVEQVVEANQNVAEFEAFGKLIFS